jgi:acyl carrier protein
LQNKVYNTKIKLKKFGGYIKTPLICSAIILQHKKQNNMSSIIERVNQIIADKLVIDKAEIVATANFKKDLGADSIDLVELIMEFEREFDIAIPDEQAESIATVGDAIAYIEQHANA